MTTDCAFFEVDINTVTVEDLSFTCEWKIRAKHRECLHALVVWFDVDFSRGFKPLRMTTSPFTTTTHWKQTVFYLNEVLRANKEDIIQGTIKCAPNKNNFRDLDIRIGVKMDGKDQSVEYDQDFRLR
eukprot:NODE_9611_length_511_cov_38.554688_g9588_i0.p1 GENE.NODE_9611_length_511_cov_38.554688_g9588_i0~~NODE_9611_length_511_cov_38.554688_g9588_i0.p1  ORF type:complete len:139 (-),score=29.80 NODE_9611_length_511_cov_38.554688_g9588_i0:94-474(-)